MAAAVPFSMEAPAGMESAVATVKVTSAVEFAATAKAASLEVVESATSMKFAAMEAFSSSPSASATELMKPVAVAPAAFAPETTPSIAIPPAVMVAPPATPTPAPAVPGARADENAVVEVGRTVVAVGSASIGVIPVVAVDAVRRQSHIRGARAIGESNGSNLNSSLSMCAGRVTREHQEKASYQSIL